jgi:predicted ribosomally synthesized peptide with nif11-like leader
MSSVEAFYTRLAEDEAFRAQIQSATSKEECSQIVKAAGYDFTQEELDAYNTKLLIEANLDPEKIQELGEKEMAEVLGGYLGDRYHLMYGAPRPRLEITPPIEIDPDSYPFPFPKHPPYYLP